MSESAQTPPASDVDLYDLLKEYTVGGADARALYPKIAKMIEDSYDDGWAAGYAKGRSVALGDLD